MTIDLIREETSLRTTFLANRGRKDLVVAVANPALLSEAEGFLRHILSHIDTDVAAKRGETIAYGYWLTKLLDAGEFLEAWEYKAGATEFVPGVTLAMTYWRDQHRVCERYQTSFEPPRPDQMVAISKGVLEGDSDVQGVRYPSPAHMSGWWLTTGQFDGNIESLKTVHAYHVTSSRPDLAHLFALPFGYRFDLSQVEDVWYDESVAALPPG